MAHLGLRFGDRSLPPDHLGGACELLACAIEHDDTVLIRELLERYFVPVDRGRGRARRRRSTRMIARLPALFAADLRDLRLSPADGANYALRVADGVATPAACPW